MKGPPSDRKWPLWSSKESNTSKFQIVRKQHKLGWDQTKRHQLHVKRHEAYLTIIFKFIFWIACVQSICTSSHMKPQQNFSSSRRMADTSGHNGQVATTLHTHSSSKLSCYMCDLRTIAKFQSIFFQHDIYFCRHTNKEGQEMVGNWTYAIFK